MSEIPFFVWPLFIILLMGGFKGRRPTTAPLGSFLLFPGLFLIWSCTSFFGTYEGSALWWLCALSIGFLGGFWHMQKVSLRFDKQKRSVALPGSWLPLIFSMSIFFSKFSIGMIEGFSPELAGSTLCLCIDLFSTAFLGAMFGRGASCWRRFKAAPDIVVD